jgi:hypothetical protein
MNIEDILGEYSVTGTNQDDSSNTYHGTLKLTLDSDYKVQANWVIDSHQTLIGSGFFTDNILEINFKYEGDDRKTYKGVVLYNCATKGLLDGVWYEEYGNPQFLGSEVCCKTNKNN